MENQHEQTLTQIDLFAGAGGLSFGFGQVGFHTLFATDFDKDSCKSFELNHPNTKVECANILELDPELLRQNLELRPGQLDALVGGPPCQGFSTYGKRDPNDSRNKLYKNYLSFLKVFFPKTFIIENVVGILSMNEGAIINDILTTTRELGYKVEYQTLDVSMYGVPQVRKRVFIIGNRLAQSIQFPQPTHGNIGESDLFNTLCPVLTVGDAISDLPEQVFLPSEMQSVTEYTSPPLNSFQEFMRRGLKMVPTHSAKRMMGTRRLRLTLMKPGEYGNELRKRIETDGLSKEFIDQFFSVSHKDAFDGCRTEDKSKELKLRALLAQGHQKIDEILSHVDSGGFANKYRRLHWNEPSHTLVAHMARDCSDFVHPEYDRFISVREAARLQSFPDWYRLYGSQFSQLKQIGNAVPPLMSLALAKSIRKVFY